MKKTFLTAAFSLMAFIAIAQKKEIRNAEKAIDDQNYAEAKSYIKQAEANLQDANEKVLQDFYYTKAMAYLGGESNHDYEDLLTASEAMKKAVELGHKDAKQGMEITKNKLIASAIEDQNKENFIIAAQKLKASYDLDNKDTLYLYYAASNYVSAKDYNKALEYYTTLKDLGFTGVEPEYLATNKETGEVEAFSKVQRDLLVRSGDYIKPVDNLTSSKTGEIAKNIALIHIQNGDNEKAILAMEAAKKENPDDINLLLVEADIYNNLGDMKKYKELMEKIITMEPNNPVLFYNLGVSSANLKDYESALRYYKKALELDPEMINAQINIAAVILQDEQKIVEEMNNLGMSAADNKKYDELLERKKAIYAEALPYLQDAHQTNPKNLEVARTLMNIYYQVNQPEKAKEMKAKIAELEAATTE